MRFRLRRLQLQSLGGFPCPQSRLGSVRITPNLRDLGGTMTGAGQILLPGRLVRSALPFADDLSPDSSPWPPAVVVDLRSDGERRQYPTLQAPTAVNLPLLDELRPESHLDGTLIALYRAVLDGAPNMLVDLVRTVADAPGTTLIHCSAGKDRTGISVALLLRLVGVERDVVMTDYMVTNDNIEAIDGRLRVLPGNEHRDALPKEYFHVVPDALDAVLDVWDAHRGGVNGWLQSAGAERDLVDRLHVSLLG